jgi:hypothetical protein
MDTHTPTQLLDQPDREGPVDVQSLDSRQASPWQRLLEPLARLAAPRTPAEPDATILRATRESLDDPGLFVPPAHRERFMHAGLRQRGAPVAFYSAKVVLALSLPLLAWLLRAPRSCWAPHCWACSCRACGCIGGSPHASGSCSRPSPMRLT